MSIETRLQVGSKPVEPHPVDKEVLNFTQQIEALSEVFPDMIDLSIEAAKAKVEKFTSYVEEFGNVEGTKEDSVRISFEPKHIISISRYGSQMTKAIKASELTPKLFVQAIVGQFDAFIGRLLRAFFILKPELTNSFEMQLAFSELVKFESIDDAKEYIIEKEIESIMRDSHADQFKWMENKFNIKLRVDLDSWPTFIELTERRNLFAHKDGEVTDQYLKVCKEHNVDLEDDCKKDACLNVTPAYFERAADCIYEIGVKLSQVLRRKLFKHEATEADKNLTDITYELIASGKHKLAITLLDFALETPSIKPPYHTKLVWLINRAQAYKWIGDDDRCRKLLDGIDLSGCALKFVLASAVLRDDYAYAAQIMEEIGNGSQEVLMGYHDWPVFQKFRLTDEFLSTYNKIYNDPFIHIEELAQKVNLPDALEDDVELISEDAQDLT